VLIKAIRADLGCDLPVIAVTAAVIGEETDELLKSGASDVISKPISVDKLSESLAKQHNREAV
jgi:CheY-like chemotaxis protein